MNTLPQHAPRPMVFLARHGATKDNNSQSSTFRGWSDSPLDSQGKKSASNLHTIFSHAPLSSVSGSDVARAHETAQTISPSAQPDPQLRSWNVGIFTGKPKDQYMGVMKKYVENPDQVIPRGESLNNFKQRVGQRIEQAKQEFQRSGKPPLLITHGSVLTAAKQHQHPEIGNDTFLHDSQIEPGGLAAILDDGSFHSLM